MKKIVGGDFLNKSTENALAKEEKLIYTITEVAAMLKVNRNFVYSLINNGYLISIKLGSRKVTRKALLEFLDKYDGDPEFDEKIPAMKETS